MVLLRLCLAIFTALALFSTAVNSVSQAELDNMAAKIDLRYDVISNLQGDGRYSAKLTLTNTGTTVITKGDWDLVFCSIRLIVPDSSTERAGVKVSHINGCLHKMTPLETFPVLAADQNVEIPFRAMNWVVAKTDIMPNWFFAADGLEPRVVKSTEGEGLSFVGKFTTEEQWKRYANDQYNPYTAQGRYDVIGFDDLGEDGWGDIVTIPQPMTVQGLERKSRVGIRADWKIFADGGFQKEAQLLKAKFNAQIASSMPFNQSKLIRLVKGDPNVTRGVASSEAYSLEIKVAEKEIKLTGSHASGVFYGVQTLIALADKENTVPMVTIKDAPRYGYRGMHLDVGRNFMEKAAVLKLLDAMATYKMNKFHFHLTDDEGWRLEIPGLEELTTVGSKRCYDINTTRCILSQLGSGPSPSTSAQYYSVSDYKEILKRANDLHIQVIPEFDMPGHGYAAIKSMEARFKRLKDSNPSEASKYILSDFNDTSKYLSIQYFTDNAINPCIESTYAFIEKVLTEVKSMHKDIQPLTVYHFGGDEVAHGAWTKSSACEQLAQRMGYNLTGSDIVDKLKGYFVERVANITVNDGLSLAGWEDGLLGHGEVPYNRKSFRNSNVMAYAWNNIWEWGSGKRAYLLANAGYKVVMTQATHLYFDFPYEPDPQERGYYWATRFTDTRKTFGFMPDNLFNNVEQKVTGEPLTREELCKTEGMCVELVKKENIIGMAGALWTETVRTADQMDSMIFPRLLAVAERAWHKASWEDISDKTERNNKRSEAWKRFATYLGHLEMTRLDAMKIKYHLPPPGARVENSKLKVRTAIQGLPVQFSKDDGKTWSDVTDSTEVRGKLVLRTKSADGTRQSRLVTLNMDVSVASRLSVARVLVTLWCFTLTSVL
ncbi:beta-hexosaminidase [Nematostella vectensis]|uniref:beta-hexosaminidase n=1 Tax=Nematostella vectensis TaxID=45351 RepID=UPI0013902540|nr:beta-hexosaminidase [Nematostella vectensis]